MPRLSDEQVRVVERTDFRRMSIGRRFWDASLERIPDEQEHKPILQKFIGNCKSFIEEGKGLVFSGPFGGGKTSCVVIIAKAVFSHKGTVLFVRASDINTLVIDKVLFDDNESYENRMLSVDLLIIDDLGKEHGRDWGIIETLVRRRSDEQKSIILTHNLRKKDLLARYGKSLVEVLRSCVIDVEVSGIDWRKEEEEVLKKAFE